MGRSRAIVSPAAVAELNAFFLRDLDFSSAATFK
jgi:hypothetical protein